MAEWSIAIDCKSIAHWASQVRILLCAQIQKTPAMPGSFDLPNRVRHAREGALSYGRISSLRMTCSPSHAARMPDIRASGSFV